MNQQLAIANKFQEIAHKEEIAYKARKFRKKFIPIELIASDPKKYGYLSLTPRESRARQGEFLKDRHKVVAIIAANRGGKSEPTVVKGLRTCLDSKVGGNYWMLTESFDSQRLGIQEKINDYLKPEDIKDIGWAKQGVYAWLRLTNGVFIEFKTYEQGREKLQSAKLIGALFDEEPPEDIFDEVYTRTVDLKGQIIMAFTPLNGMTWSYKRIYSNKGGMISVYNWGMADNPFIPIEEIEEMRRNLSPKKVKIRLYGEYQGSERAILENFYRTKHVKKALYNPDLPVDVSVDWGINVTAVGFYQSYKGLRTDITTGITRMVEEHYLVDGAELSGFSYPQVMNYIINKKYWIENWYCDPAGRARSQASKSGKSLLSMIKDEFGIQFTYLPKLGVEESIDVLNSYLENAKGEARFFIQEGIKLNATGDSPEMRFENYIRDEETGQPIKDGVNDHFIDQARYYLMNKIRGQKSIFSQH